MQPGCGWFVRDGRDLVVFGYGPWLLSNAWHAAEELERTAGITTRVINLPWLNRIDLAWLQDAIGDRRTIVLLDNHYVRGGQGEMIAAAIAELALEPSRTVRRAGVTALPECGTNDEVLAYHRLDRASLLEVFRAAVSGDRSGAVVSPA